MPTAKRNRDAIIVLSLIALFYAAKWVYYGTPISHAMQFKQIAIYYHAQPLAVIQTWLHFAVAAPVFAVLGMTDRRVWWLGGYIAVSMAACMFGPNSDYSRYTIHLFPLMLIAGSPFMRRNR